MMDDAPLDACYLTGPTASGKTAVAIDWAQRLSAEIISLDSMALYRGLDIGTAKPSPAERQAVPHHLLDLLDPQQEYSLAEYVSAARTAAAEIAARGRAVLFVGGTPLYLKALLRGIFEGPPADWDFRARLEEAAQREPPGHLHRELQAVDPAAAAKLHPGDTRRLIRALEVQEKTGRPISAWQQQFAHGRAAADCRVFCLDLPRAELYARINARVEAMFAAGLVAEVERLLASGVTLGRTASQALGYREVIAHLRGERSLSATIELVQNRTRQFARRQLTWFRSLSECRFVSVAAGDSPATIVDRLVQLDFLPPSPRSGERGRG